MKKILVLGGVGAMASETTIDLVQTSDFDEIMIADINLDKIETFIKYSGDKRLKAAKINAESVTEMAGLMAGYDVVANGLPRIYCENAIKAAIKARVGMLDFISHYLLSSPEGDQTELWGYSVQVEVAGILRGHDVLYRFVTSHPPMDKWGGQRAYAKNVGIPLSIGAQMLAEGKAKKNGVDGAETMLPAEEFVIELRKRDFVINESMTYL